MPEKRKQENEEQNTSSSEENGHKTKRPAIEKQLSWTEERAAMIEKRQLEHERLTALDQENNKNSSIADQQTLMNSLKDSSDYNLSQETLPASPKASEDDLSGAYSSNADKGEEYAAKNQPELYSFLQRSGNEVYEEATKSPVGALYKLSSETILPSTPVDSEKDPYDNTHPSNKIN